MSPLSILMVIYKGMLKRVMLPVLIVLLWITACASPTEPASLKPTEGPATATAQEVTAIPTSTSVPEQIEQQTPTLEYTDVVETPETDCPGKPTNTIGQGIADEYEFTGYEEVITWFCDGAEFEDILVALQTEDQTGFLAEEMLVMLADGFSWEEIWMVVDLIE